jgi:hypothetical protein
MLLYLHYNVRGTTLYICHYARGTTICNARVTTLCMSNKYLIITGNNFTVKWYSSLFLFFCSLDSKIRLYLIKIIKNIIYFNFRGHNGVKSVIQSFKTDVSTSVLCYKHFEIVTQRCICIWKKIWLFVGFELEPPSTQTRWKIILYITETEAINCKQGAEVVLIVINPLLV